jgi:hypothetical protein
MRSPWLILCAALAACTSAPPPGDQIVYEVPLAAPQPDQASGRDDFTSRIEAALGEEGTVAGQVPAAAPATYPAPATAIDPALATGMPADTVPPGATATPLDDDRLNLGLYTLEQQRIDAAIAEQELAEARSQLVIVQPGSVPQAPEGVNIALYAAQTTNAVGERRYSRGFGLGAGSCRRYPTPDQAQRAFLAAGGPERDAHGLDPDGDGFACSWDPEPYRRLAQ